MDIRHTRNVYNSIFKHIKSLLTSGSLIDNTEGSLTLMDAYPTEDQLKKMVSLKDYDSTDSSLIALPVITVETESFRERGRQLGSKSKDRTTPMMFSVFAETDIQADYLADFLVSGMDRHDLRLYDFNQDYTSPPDTGKIIIEDDYAAFFHYFEASNQIFRNSIDLVFTLRTTN